MKINNNNNINITSNSSMNINEIINNKINQNPNTRILKDIKKEINSLYNNSVTLNTPLDTTLSLLKHIENNRPISENIDAINNLELVDKDSLFSMIDIHHREKKKDYSAISIYSNILEKIRINTINKEIKLTKEFMKLSDKIIDNHTIIKDTIKILDSYFQNLKDKLDETPELEKKINEYDDQNKILSSLIKYNTSQKNIGMKIEKETSKANKYNENLNKVIDELCTITSNYISILENSDQLKDHNKILELITNHKESIEKINTTYLKF
ncbi:hypothetical protein F9282_17920 [Proteus terrae subsp. cibarius]|uniref:IpaD/SipD/SspD family type III secretion system needle tip protein n=1 Tax=Proteus terrae subsp. cibarius TaxID=626774 RepID=A0ABX6JRM6_9GAMM|nr:hypothetical protein [Proteus terrae]QGW04745.1 hypothetical protein F9282_17920 [Proteus terrae subsp. cibarius]QIF91848.1 hypothetical protein GTH23_18325 [Proteus terrae subsp. cibarius]QIF99490.1 hypothetical protein GTH25_16185 [Proteus terrae subsp. cibarius]